MSETTTNEDKTRDYSQYKIKAPSHLHNDFAKYIEVKTGFKGIDPKVIQLALALHGEYQSSPERKAARDAEIAERKAAAEAAKSKKQGGPRSPEARELKQLKSAARTLEDLKQPVPAATKKRIAELEAKLSEATKAAEGGVEVPAQKSGAPDPESLAGDAFEEHKLLNA